jgi:hypothetical protein
MALQLPDQRKDEGPKRHQFHRNSAWGSLREVPANLLDSRIEVARDQGAKTERLSTVVEGQRRCTPP